MTLALVTLLAYVRLCGNEFVDYDDPEYVTENPHVYGGISYQSIIWAFSNPHEANWHPLTWISHMLDCELFGLNPAMHHLTNLLFHIANTLLLFWIFQRMTGKVWPSAIISALFALHPLHVESVAWVAERKDVLSTFFWFATTAAYVRYTEHVCVRRYFPVVLFFAFGLMAKPMVVTLPFVLLLMDYWPLERFKWKVITEKAPLFILTAISCTVTYLAQQAEGSVGLIEKLSLKYRIANAVTSYVTYIIKIFFPARLAVLYPHQGENLPLFQVLLCAVTLLILSVGVVLFARQKKYLLSGWLWYLGTLVPVIGLIQVGYQSIADRYTYIPATGIFIIIAWGVPELLSRWRYRKIVLSIISVAIVFALSFLTHRQVKYWKNSLTLFNRTVEVTKNNYIIHSNYGYSLSNAGQKDLAIQHLNESLRIKPDYTKAMINLGAVLKDLGRTNEAVEQWERVLELDAYNAPTHSNLGLVLTEQGEYNKAIEHFNISLAVKPDSKSYFVLGFIYHRLSQHDPAIQNFKQALLLKPDYPEVYFVLAVLYSEIGKHELSIQTYQHLINIKPDYPGALNNLGAELNETGRSYEAIEAWKRALELPEPDLHIHFNIGRLLFGQGKYEKAIVHFQKALTAYPDWIDIYGYLGQAYDRLRKDNLAVQNYYKLLQHKTGQVDILNKLAWILATNEDDKLRNPADAVKFARQGCELTDYKNPELLDTLAVAYAAAGRFPDAVTTAQKALRISRSSQQKNLFQKHLSLFEVSKPYIESRN